MRQQRCETETKNGYEVGRGALPRITGKKLAGIPSPAKAVLVGEWPVSFGGSWHPLFREDYAGARAGLSFVDGHTDFTKIYWDGVPDSSPCNYEPPLGFTYNWDGE